MDELTMKGLTTPEDLFSHRHKGTSSPPRPILMTNGNSSPNEMKPLDLKNISSGDTSSPSSPISQTATWRPHHEYSKASNIPTPFTIKDILGLGDEETSLEDEEEKVEDEEEKVETHEEVDDEYTMFPALPTTPTIPSPPPMSMELDEPLNLTVVKRESSRSPCSSSEETNNNRLVNGSGRLFMGKSRDKSPTGALLPNDVIIPKVKHPKISTAVALKNGGKSKGCGAINLKTSTKRKSKDRGGPSPKMLAVDTGGRSEAGTPIPHSTPGLISPGLENGSSNDSKKRKKARTTFTGKQIYELERQFEIKKYLSSSERIVSNSFLYMWGRRSEMARLLNVTEVQVKIWFQNRRTKWKKQGNISNAEAAEHKVMATKGPGSKKEKNASSNNHKGTPLTGKKTGGSSSSGGGGRLPGTSECSLSISGSMDSSDDHDAEDHSNGSLSDGNNTSEGGSDEPSESTISKTSPNPPADFSLLQQKLQQQPPNYNQAPPAPSSPSASNTNSVLLSHLSRSPPGPPAVGYPLEGNGQPPRGRSPVISIPRLLLSSTLLHREPISSPSLKEDLKHSSSIITTPTPTPHEDEEAMILDDEEDEEQVKTPRIELEMEQPSSSSLMVSVCGSLGERDSGGGGVGDGVVTVNNDLENKSPFSPVMNQAS